MERFSRLILIFSLASCYLARFIESFFELDFSGPPLWQLIFVLFKTVLIFIAMLGSFFSAFFVWRSFSQRSCYVQAKRVGSLALSVGFFVHFFLLFVVIDNKLFPFTQMDPTSSNQHLIIALLSLMGILFLESFGSWSNSRDKYRYRNNSNNRYSNNNGGRSHHTRRYQGSGGQQGGNRSLSS